MLKSKYTNRAQRLAAAAKRRKDSRAQMSEEGRNSANAANAQRMRQTRAQMSEEERNSADAADAQRMRQTRAQMSEEERNSADAANAQRMRQTRALMSEEEHSRERAREAERRAQITEEQRQRVKELHAASERRRAERVRANQLQKIHGIGIYEHCEIDETTIIEHSCGRLEVMCETCGSLNFKDERPQDKKFSMCCHKGKVNLPPIHYPDKLKDLLTGKDNDSTHFMENIRKYNSAMAFASMGAQVSPPPGHGPYCFRVHGQVYHQSGPLHPLPGESPVFAQIYILDPEEALNQRMSIHANSGCKPHLMRMLGHLMHEVSNPYAQAYKMMHEVELEEKAKATAEGRIIREVGMAIVQGTDTDPRRYNAPRVNEVAIVFTSTDGAPPTNRDFRVNLRSEHRSQNISVLNPNLDPMCYPLLYPCGYPQCWRPDLQQESGNRRVSQLQWYSYQLAIRTSNILRQSPALWHSGTEPSFNPILNAGKLTQQYIVDAYCKVVGNRLNFIQQNQKKLRTEKYTVLENVTRSANDKGLRVGRQVILPSTFEGSPRAMTQHFQDAMAICCKYGKPDLFITMTCNPKWKEILQNLETWQKAEHRPDLIARVFQLKLKQLLKDIMHDHILGCPVAKVHVIEFQKRGLPHAHILVILRAEDKPTTNEIIDRLISAEIPDPNTHPRLHEIVMKTMIHGPCGDANPSCPCMKDGKCSKKFPKNTCNNTISNLNGFPLYRRRNTGLKYKVGDKSVDNQWVVPYNPYLSLKYNCHINTEICSSIKSLKYLFKYIYKGHDCATIKVTGGVKTLEHDEVQTYLDTRYVSAPEAIWRLFEFRMHDQSHVVQKLSIHLEGEQPVFFEEGEEIEALDRNSDRDNTLTAWFKLNQEDHNAHQYLYTEIPEHYTFIKKDKNGRERFWKPRQRGAEKIIGRMYNISLSQGDLFYLRLLLLCTKGATSYDSLRTVNGIVCSTFKQAAMQRHLLDDDSEWDNCLAEAVTVHTPFKLRELFAFICVYGSPAEPIALWTKYKEHFIEDFVNLNLSEVDAELYALQDVETTLAANQQSLQKVFGDTLPALPANLPPLPMDNIDYAEEQRLAAESVEKLNILQKEAFDEVMNAVEDDTSPQRLYFLDGPGGSGKTFTYETLYHTLTGVHINVMSCAPTGIAANLLPFGKTYHSTFGLGPTLHEKTVSNISCNSNAGKLLRETKIIIWDEVTMTPFYALDVVDRLLRDLTKDNRPFGGKVVLLGGDFRQILPVVKRGNRVKIVESCIKSSKLWGLFCHLKLHENMRVSGDADDFCSWLLKLGDGKLGNDAGLGEEIIEIPQNFIVTESVLDSIFGKEMLLEDAESFQNKAILTPLNEDVHKLNKQLLNRLEGESRTYLSSDSIVPVGDINTTDYPPEVLNSQAPSGTPPHELILKKGAIIMLLRNLNSRRGLCNGTRMTVQKMLNNLIIAKVLTGRARGQDVFIPRIDIVPTDTDLPFQIKRRQFPVMLAFVMTINKSQGQSMDSVGIYLPNPVFCHGQLYVAFSRARSPAGLKVQVLDRHSQGKMIPGSDRVFTRNVVYKEVFETDCNSERYYDQMLIDAAEEAEILEAERLSLLMLQSSISVDQEMFDWVEGVEVEPVPESDITEGVEVEPDPDSAMPWHTRDPNLHIYDL